MTIEELIRLLTDAADEEGEGTEAEVRLVVDYQTGNDWPISQVEYGFDDGVLIYPDFHRSS
jgi:hypothetical protein